MTAIHIKPAARLAPVLLALLMLALVVGGAGATLTYANHTAQYYPDNLISFPLQDDGNNLTTFEATGKPGLNNTAVNSGFESQAGGDPDFFTGWSETVGSGGSVKNETTIIHTGSYAANLTSGSAVSMVSQNINVLSNHTYTFGFWTRGDGTNAGQYSVYDVTHSAWIISLTTTGISSATYTRKNLSIFAPSGTAQIRIYLSSSPSPGKSAYFDDVFFNESRIYGTLPSGKITFSEPGPPFLTEDNKSFNFSYQDAYVGIGNPTFNDYWNGDVGTAVAWGMVYNASLWSDSTTYRYTWHAKASNNDTWYSVFGKSTAANTLAWRYRQGGATNEHTYVFTTPPTGKWFAQAMAWNTTSGRMRGYLYVPDTATYAEVFNDTITGVTSWGDHPVDDNNNVLYAGSATQQEWGGSGTQAHYWSGIDLNESALRDILTYGSAATPAASFTLSSPLVLIPQSITANSTSTNSPTLLNWSWGDNTWTNQSGDDPDASHLYSTTGNYSVYLIASNAAGSNTSGIQYVDVILPYSIHNLTNNTPTYSEITWSWEWETPAPIDTVLMIYRNGTFWTNSSNTTTSRLWNNLGMGTNMTFSSKVCYANGGECNQTWENRTTKTLGYGPDCPTPTPTTNPWVNPPNNTDGTPSDGKASSVFATGFSMLLLVFLIVVVVTVIIAWRMFQKGGSVGWLLPFALSVCVALLIIICIYYLSVAFGSATESIIPP